MNSFHQLKPIPLKRVLANNPDTNIEKLLNSIIDGNTTLYMLIPPGQWIDKAPLDEDLYHILLPTKGTKSDNWHNDLIAVWAQTANSQNRPNALKLDPDCATAIAENVLYSYLAEDDDQFLRSALKAGDIKLLDESGNVMVTAARPIGTMGEAVPSIDIDHAIAESYPWFEGNYDYFETSSLSLCFGELAISKRELPNFVDPNSIPGHRSPMAEHWGPKLQMLIRASNQFWNEDKVDRSDEDTFPVNKDVTQWFIDRDIDPQTARLFANIVLPSWGKAKRRKKE